jgi:hypothetical protein
MPSPTRDQVVTAAALGAAAGAALGARRGAAGAALAAAAGAAATGGSEALARVTQRPDEIPALWHRILMSAAIAAPFGWLAEHAVGPRPELVRLAAGAVAGGMGLRPQKVVLGPAVGWLVARTLTQRGETSAATVAAAVVTVYRIVSAAVFRDPQVALLAERARAPDVPFVVPLGSILARHPTPVAHLGPPWLPALPVPRRPPARPGERPEQPAAGAAGGAQPDRHDRCRP